jgi:hypothetical protein
MVSWGTAGLPTLRASFRWMQWCSTWASGVGSRRWPRSAVEIGTPSRGRGMKTGVSPLNRLTACSSRVLSACRERHSSGTPSHLCGSRCTLGLRFVGAAGRRIAGCAVGYPPTRSALCATQRTKPSISCPSTAVSLKGCGVGWSKASTCPTSYRNRAWGSMTGGCMQAALSRRRTGGMPTR